MKKGEYTAINFLEPVNEPQDIWTSMYDWVFKVGRFLLVAVEVLVLAVFVSRFVIDQKNNDLTEAINEKVSLLSDPQLRRKEILFSNLHLLFNDVKYLQENQKLNSDQISAISEGISDGVTLKLFSYSADRVNLSLSANTFAAINEYEHRLRQNPDYSDVNITLSKSGVSNTAIEFTVTFKILQ